MQSGDARDGKIGRGDRWRSPRRAAESWRQRTREDAVLKAWPRLPSIERALLVTVLLIGAALFAFFKLASEVSEGDTMALDRAILAGLRSPADPALPIGPKWLPEAMTDFTALGGATILWLVCMAVIFYLLLGRRPRTALFVFAATAGGIALGGLLKLIYARPRPALVPHLVDVTSSSFPSGHATDSAIVYLTLAALLARSIPERTLRIYIIGVAILLTLLIGASRVYLGVHWPSDVAAGWAIGAAWALGWSLAYSRIRGIEARPMR